MKLNRFLVAAFATFALVGCETEPIDESGEGGVTDPVNGYTIVLDKETIEANGIDAVTFQVLDAEGNDILVNEDGTDSDMLSKVYFVIAETEKRLERKTKTFTAFCNGEYTFYATVRGERTVNEVKVTSQNRGAYEKYLQKVCVYQCTATWCQFCPQMTEALNGLREGQYGENVIVLACHGEDDYALPWSKAYDLGQYVRSRTNGSGYPHAGYDMMFGSPQRSGVMLTSYIENILRNYPSTCGVKISEATIDDEGNAKITASVKASKDGVFDLGCAILADNQPSKDGYEPVYNDVVAAVSPNFVDMSDEKKVSLKADEEFTKEFTVKLEAFPGVTFNKNDYKVVIYAHSEASGGIDNANICKFGESVDYILND